MSKELFEDWSFRKYFGDFIGDYDYDAIVDAVTEIDYRNGNRYFTDECMAMDGDEFAEFIKRFEREIKYAVYEDTMLLCQYDERYIEKRENETATLEAVELFDTQEEAETFLESMVSEWEKPCEVIHTKRGLDTIKYHSAWIDRQVLDKDGSVISDPMVVKSIDSMPDEVMEAASRHQTEYWEFLDYKRDHYTPLEV